MQGLADYRNNTKETWRNWAWNRAIELQPELRDRRRRTPANIRRVLANKTAIYLVGPEDLDRQVAIAKGFRNENLIAIDVEKENIARVRKAGGIGVCCDIADAILAWQQEQIDIVMADFCGGISTNLWRLLHSMIISQNVGGHSVLCVNMLRGRDGQSNQLREDLWNYLQSMNPQIRKCCLGNNGKDRAKILFAILLDLYAYMLRRCGCTEREVVKIGMRYVKCRSIYHYRANGQSMAWFDSLVTYGPPKIVFQPKSPEWDSETYAIIRKLKTETKHKTPDGFKKHMDGVVRMLNACKAVRTQRRAKG